MQQMKAVRIAQFGEADQLQVMETPLPEPGPGEVLVKLAYSGVNFIDVYMRKGVYARSHTYETPLPLTVGMEGGGHVVAVGEQVKGFAVGERVAYCLGRGSYAEFAAVPAWKLVPVPKDVPLSVATALMLQGCTAHYLASSAFVLAEGQTCLVHAGAGGVGQLLVQLAKLRGARVIATVGSAEKAAIATRCGADACILYRETDFRDEVLRLTGGKGVDVVYDSVGKDTIERSIRCLRRRGVCILYGASSGAVNAITPLELAEAGSVFFTRPHLADYIASSEEIRQRCGELFAFWSAGRLRATIDREFPLAEAAQAHRLLEGRGTRGKLLLRVAEEAKA